MRPDELHVKLMETMSDEERRDFEVGLKALNMDNPADREALRESIKRLRPDFTEAQIELFVGGEIKPISEWSLTESSGDDFWPNRVEQLSIAVRELHPGMSDEDIAKWVDSHEGRAVAMKSDSSSKDASAIVLDLEREDTERAAEQAIPDALKVLYLDWSREKINEWISQHDTLIKSFRGLHPEWDEEQLVTAIDNEDVNASETRYRGRPSIKPKNDHQAITTIGRASKASDREALIASLKRAHPDWTDRQIEIFCNPEA